MWWRGPASQRTATTVDDSHAAPAPSAISVFMSGLPWRTAIQPAAQVARARPEHDDRAEHELRDHARGRPIAIPCAIAIASSGTARAIARIASRRSERGLVPPGQGDRGEPRDAGRGRVERIRGNFVAGLADRGGGGRGVHLRRVEHDAGARQRQVDVGAGHARQRPDRALDAPHARGAGHAEDG